MYGLNTTIHANCCLKALSESAVLTRMWFALQAQGLMLDFFKFTFFFFVLQSWSASRVLFEVDDFFSTKKRLAMLFDKKNFWPVNGGEFPERCAANWAKQQAVDFSPQILMLLSVYFMTLVLSLIIKVQARRSMIWINNVTGTIVFN